jgi:hypothetical protein
VVSEIRRLTIDALYGAYSFTGWYPKQALQH